VVEHINKRYKNGTLSSVERARVNNQESPQVTIERERVVGKDVVDVGARLDKTLVGGDQRVAKSGDLNTNGRGLQLFQISIGPRERVRGKVGWEDIDVGLVLRVLHKRVVHQENNEWLGVVAPLGERWERSFGDGDFSIDNKRLWSLDQEVFVLQSAKHVR
jgi:hypothetical protein